jgi:hypothetical protein
MVFSKLEKEILEMAATLFIGTAYRYHDWVLESEFLSTIHKLIDMDILYEENIQVEGDSDIQVYKIKSI